MPIPNPFSRVVTVVTTGNSDPVIQAIPVPAGCAYCGVYAMPDGTYACPSCGAPKPTQVMAITQEVPFSHSNQLALEAFVLNTIRKVMRP